MKPIIDVISTRSEDGEKYLGRIVAGPNVKCMGVINIGDSTGALVTFAPGRWALVKNDEIEKIDGRDAVCAFSKRTNEEHCDLMNRIIFESQKIRNKIKSFLVGDPPHPQCFSCGSISADDCAQCTAHDEEK